MAELRMMSADELCEAELKAPRRKMHTLKVTAAQMHAVARRQLWQLRLPLVLPPTCSARMHNAQKIIKNKKGKPKTFQTIF